MFDAVKQIILFLTQYRLSCDNRNVLFIKPTRWYEVKAIFLGIK